jgi:uncharacterized membrane protein
LEQIALSLDAARFRPFLSKSNPASILGSWSRSERLVLAAVCVLTLIFVIITPPFEAPDETQHFMKALALSRGSLFADVRGPEIGHALPSAATDLYLEDFAVAVPGIRRIYRPGEIGASWHADEARPGQTFASFPNAAGYPPTLYLPQAIGMAMARLLGLPALGAFYAGRLLNALTALGLLAAALRIMPFGRYVVLAVAALPTTAYQAASLSPDATINAGAFLALALTLRVGRQVANGSSLIALPAVSVLLGLAKGVYVPVLVAGLRWPFERRNASLILASTAVAVIAFIGWMKVAGGAQAAYIVSRKTGLLVQTAPLTSQLAVILNDPAGFSRILLSSITERAPVYALQVVGRFGWNAILLPLFAYPLAFLMLGFALWSSDAHRIPAARRLWWLALAVGGELLIEIALFLTGTPSGADYVQGVQGRYFLPLLPLAGLALLPGSANRTSNAGARAAFAAAAILLQTLALLTVLDSFWIHGFVTWNGLPPIAQNAGGLVRALFLPSPRW